MQRHPLLLAFTGTVIAAAAVSQTSLWTPSGYAGVPGNSNNGFPWNHDAQPIRYQQIYSALNFTQQGVHVPVPITRLRFRAAVPSGAWLGGSWPSVVLNMSTAARSYSNISGNFAANQGPNLTNVYTGPVTVMAGAGNGSGAPGPVYVDIVLATPFVHDPSAGDLCLEIANSGIGWSGASTQCDAVQGNGLAGPALSRRIYNLGSPTAATGIVEGFDYGLVTEFSWGGHASATAYGTGCFGLSLGASARPMLGTSIQLVTTGIPSGTLLGAAVLSNVRHDPGLDLGSIGMPGCRQYVDLETTHIFLVSGTSGSLLQNIPNSPSFIAVNVHCQSATFSPGFDPLGVIASNGLTLVLDVL